MCLPDAPCRRCSRLLSAGAAAALFGHGTLLAVIVLLNRTPDFPGGVREIPVELVAPPVGPGNKTPEAPGESSGKLPEAGPQLSSKDQAGTPASQPLAVEPPPGASGKKSARSEGSTQMAAPAPPGIGTIGRPGEAGTFPVSPFGSGSESFHAVDVPLPGGGDGDAMNYSYIVGGMLKRMVHPPESALKRGAKGVATVGFVLDQSGGVASAVLLHSSGRADLDAESVAVVRRAAPFPPPPGAQHSFVIEVAFGRRN